MEIRSKLSILQRNLCVFQVFYVFNPNKTLSYFMIYRQYIVVFQCQHISQEWLLLNSSSFDLAEDLAPNYVFNRYLELEKRCSLLPEKIVIVLLMEIAFDASLALTMVK